MSFPDSNNESESTVTASQMLVQARDARGMSQKDVADELFLTLTFIRYIEQGEFHKLPKAAFIKGYLRSYAKAVGLDGDVVVRTYERDQNIVPEEPEIVPVTEETVGTIAFTGPVVATGLISLVAVLLVAALVWWLSSGDKGPPPVSEIDSPVLTQVPVAELPTRVDPEALSKAGDEKAASEAAAAEAREDEDVTGNGLPANSETTPPATVDTDNTATETDGVKTEATIQKATDVTITSRQDGNKQSIIVRAGAGNDTMAFTFSDSCWVQITDARHQEIYANLNHAGDDLTVYGKAPFVVLLGKAPAVNMTWQGNPVDLPRYTSRDQTAKIRTARL